MLSSFSVIFHKFQLIRLFCYLSFPQVENAGHDLVKDKCAIGIMAFFEFTYLLGDINRYLQDRLNGIVLCVLMSRNL